ncbi:hypothetical protein RBSWK_02616 [Rhodopirellula baltica SWK14]|uniref:Uncharacterized protein n=1 Tax=Rhodopirellula baltica SWK14 TaxID=993516 RepID=L7CK51_RHOBT|nr:hypothetical protein RBSWK_02616 [Rhodopirellula baltica SWK14]
MQITCGLIVNRVPCHRDCDGEKALVEQVFSNGCQLFSLTPNTNFLHGPLMQDIQQECQADDMIEMGVTKKDIEVVGFDKLGQTENSRARIKQHAGLR